MIRLGKATDGDIDFLLQLRNNPAIRKWFFDSGEAARKNHLQWVSQNKDTVYIVYCGTDRIGQISFRKEGSSAYPSISILP